LLQDSPARFPEGSTASGVVKLQVVITEEGKVSEVKVTEGVAPELDQAAVTAAQGLTFQPARLDGAPVPVAIEYVYHFQAPPPPQPKAILTGVVRAKGTRAPIAGATVAAAGQSAVTDEAGRFQLELPPGEHPVQVTALAHLALSAQETLADKQSVEVRYTLEPERFNPYQTVVRADDVRREVSRETLAEQELREVPGAMGDPFRAALSLPSVTTVAGGNSNVVVRGSSPGSTVFYLEGVRVPLLFHLFLGPSVVHPEFVEAIHVYPGAAPVLYPGTLGGVFDGRVSRARDDRPHASLELNIFGVHGFVEAKLDPYTSVSVAGRFGAGINLGLSLLSVAEPDIEDTFGASLYDYQARIERRIGAGRLRLFIYGSSDRVEVTNPSYENRLSIDFLRADLRYRQPVTDGELEAGVQVGRDRAVAYDRNPTLDEESSGVESLLNARVSVTRTLSAESELLLGAQLELGAANNYSRLFDIDPAGNRTGSEIRLLGNGGRYSLFGQWTLRPVPQLDLVGGLRLDAYHLMPGTLHFAVEPRLVARYQLAPGVVLKGGAAWVHQPPSTLLNLPGIAINGLRFGLQESLQFEAGGEWKPLSWLDVGVSGYVNPLLRTVDLAPGLSDSSGTLGLFNLDVGEDPSSWGLAYGVDVLLRHKIGDGWFGWLGYGWQKSLRHSEYVVYDALGQATGSRSGLLPFITEREHRLNLAMSWQLPGQWTVGGSFEFATGSPEAGGLTSRTHRPAEGTDGPYWAIVTRDQVDRLPPSYRVHARVSKSWLWDDLAVEAYLDFQNLTFAQDVADYEYHRVVDPESGAVSLVKEEFGQGLIVPLLGVKAVY